MTGERDDKPRHDPTTSDLAQRWTKLKNAEPKLRIRDAAARLGVSEMELAGNAS